MLINLFIMFVKLATFAFGGGYVMIPSLIKASEANGWVTASDLTEIIAIAGMSPGPVAVNVAVGYGYKVAGLPGAVACFMGIAVPSTVIVIFVATFFFKIYKNSKVQAALYGLRPVITAIILYAAVSLALKNNMIAAVNGKMIEKGFYISVFGMNLFDLKSIAIIATTFIILLKTKVSPVVIILSSGLLGIIIF